MREKNRNDLSDQTASLKTRLTQLLKVVIWFGLLAGLTEAALLAANKFLLSQTIYFNAAVIWMAPVANTFLFVIAILILLLFGWGIQRSTSLISVVLALTFLSFFGLLLRVPRLHWLASVVLAVGFAVQTVRFVRAHPDGFLSLVRVTTVYIISLISGMTLIIYGWQYISERSSLAKLPAASPDAPNVLLITLDTVRAQNMSLYGYTRNTTPQLEQLAKSGVTFQKALATAPWTLPSHASMFTGRFTHELSVNWDKPLDATYPTLAEVLRQHGYVTAGFVANPIYGSYEFGLNRGFIHYEDYPTSVGQIISSSSLGRTIASQLWIRKIINYYEILGRKTASDVNENFLRWLSKHKQKPFFVFLNYYDAHGPYLPPEPFASKFGSKNLRKNPWLTEGESKEFSPQDVATEMDAYDGAIAYLDHNIGVLLEALENLGVRENTLIIITSDHGEEFQEHGLLGHGSSLYLQSLHVPFVLSFPSVLPKGKTISKPISIRDIPSTVIDLLKLNDNAHFPGSSLRRYWDESLKPDVGQSQLLAEVPFAPNLPEWYPVSKGSMKSFVVDRYHYIINGDGRGELYDIENDPLEKRDLSDSLEGLKIIEQLGLSSEATLLKKLSKHE